MSDTSVRLSWWEHWAKLAEAILPRRYHWLIVPNTMMPATAFFDGQAGEPMLQDKPESTLPKLKQGERYCTDEETARIQQRSNVHYGIRYLLEHQPMVESQRRILVHALGVLDSFA
jgi:hypothetical protein